MVEFCRYVCILLYFRSCDHTTCFDWPLPLIISASICIFLVAVTVTLTSPFEPIFPLTLEVAKGWALYEVILPVVCLDEASVMTCKRPETNQFWLIAWSFSADATSIVRLCGFPSTRRGIKGDRSKK